MENLNNFASSVVELSSVPLALLSSSASDLVSVSTSTSLGSAAIGSTTAVLAVSVVSEASSAVMSVSSLVPPISPRQTSSVLGTLWYGFLWFWSTVVFKVMNLILLCVPSVIVNALSKNFDIQLTLSSILIALSFIIAVCFLIVRYKYLTGYSKDTRAEPNGKIKVSASTTSLKNKSMDYVGQKKNEKRSTSNYLDEFLSAIKVFGYLEKSVFHELTKNMTTQKLSQDEILYLDEKLGFSIVVEGVMQVYTRIATENANVNTTYELDDENELNFEKDDVLIIDNQRYQLLNEVKSGAPLSSLMSTLDLFKSDFPDSNNGTMDSFNMSNDSILKSQSENTGISPFDGIINPSDSVPPSPMMKPRAEKSVYPDIVARPKPRAHEHSGRGHSHNFHYSGATIAIIPYSAFQRVQSKYPKATSHIVTMVLTRLYKVTMNTVHNYLGLTREIIESEVKLNGVDGIEGANLPGYLYDGLLEKIYGNNGINGTTLTRQSDFQRTTSSALLKQKPKLSNHNSRYVVLDSRLKSTHPGDLLSSVPLSRRSDYYQSHSNALEDSPTQRKAKVSSSSSKTLSSLASTIHLNRESSNLKFESIRDRSFTNDREETEETSLRIAIVENIFKLLGINDNTSMSSSFSLFSSGQSSLSSSMVGLSSLMTDDNSSGKYESNAGRVRFDSLNGLSTNSTSITRSSTPIKLYNTINMSHVHGYNSNESDSINHSNGNTSSSKQHHGKRNSAVSDFNFNNVKNDFAKVLEIKYYGPSTTIVEQGNFNSGLYYVIDGSLDIIYQQKSQEEQHLNGAKNSNERTKKIYSVKQGGLAGYLSCVLGFRSLVTIKTPKKKGVILAHISKADYSKLMDRYYFLQLPVATKLKNSLSRQILTIDYALEWCHIPAGGVLCSQGDLANGFHIVLSGRFRVVRNNSDNSVEESDSKDEYNDFDENLDGETTASKINAEDVEILGEYGHGESIGEVEVLTASRRTNSLIAVRDSETARIPRTLFEMLSLSNPSIMIKVSRIVASKALSKDISYSQPARSSGLIGSSTASHISNDYKTITILPTVSGLPVREFADKLVHALKTIGRNVIALDQASTLTHLGRHAFDERLAQLKLSGYFAYLEEMYETIVYVCDTPLKSNWTSTCISQGDCILLLADAEDGVVATGVGDYERLLMKFKTTARTDLCLIHPEKSVEPGSTSIWLKNRIWVQGHHHIQMEISRKPQDSIKKSNIISDLAARININNSIFKSRFEDVKTRAISSFVKLNRNFSKDDSYKVVQSHKNDFLRLARILSNEAVGLVLGGGGSRGISHVGVVTALERQGIPIDLIGGTSIGSFVGGLYAKDYNIVSIYGRAKRFSRRVASIWRSLFDLTYPVTSYITGYEFNRGIWKIFGFTEIEDFWIRYFCNSTNITNSTMDIHETGYSWRFIRASMSLAGLLPPIAHNGCMLLDGGYLDNLPVSEMKKKGAKYIIAVDVGSVDDRTPMNYGDTLSGFWVLFNRWNPFSKHPNVPNMMDIQQRLAYVASVNALELAKKTPGVIYLRPPIDNYATLDFAKFDEIYHVGLDYADKFFTNWSKNGKLPPIAGMVDKTKLKCGEEKKILYRRNSI
ncbi:uncharacterized protein RJT20DRAFT_131249 [Scheffersomyces xylosifermentans]|uniref:uncharacterized protein n=1 Tax=Scheffersomyces xylosifermentans TaxID=1304137 RepID=UPI00315D234A